MNEKILIVDDDHNIHEVLRLYLEREGYSLFYAVDGSKGLDTFRNTMPDLIILDIMLPIINGWEVCQLIRQDSNVPILMLTSKDTAEDKLMGFDYGADDYVIKPFDPKEVVARVKALLKRSKRLDEHGASMNSETETAVSTNKKASNNADTIEIGDIKVNLSTYEVLVKNALVQLKPKEIQLLFFLLKNPKIVFTREQLLEKVWGFEYYGETRTVDVHVKRVREKLEDAKGVEIKTIWGVGYKLEI